MTGWGIPKPKTVFVLEAADPNGPERLDFPLWAPGQVLL